MENKNLSETRVIRWLKKIFSIQTIAVIAGLVAAYYTFISYKDNQPTQLSIVMSHLGGMKDCDGVEAFQNLILKEKTKYQYQKTNHISPHFLSEEETSYLILDSSPNTLFTLGIPQIVNKTNKSIKNLWIEIDLISRGFEIPLESICQDFSVTSYLSWEEYSSITLRYNYNIVHANTCIPIPISSINLPQIELLCKEIPTSIEFCYRIVYDGIRQPLVFRISDQIIFYENLPMLEIQEHINEYLTKCYQEECFSNDRKKTLVTIIDENTQRYFIIKPPKRLTDEKFEKYKRDFIDNNRIGGHKLWRF